MPSETTLYECDHESFPGCSFTSENKAAVEYHERRHEMDHLIDRIANVHDHKHFVQEEVIAWLEDWLEYGSMAGTVSCQSCGEQTHSLFDQCPHCHEPVHPLADSATLRCGECDSDELRVMLKGGNRNKQGVRYTDCGTFVAHVDGYVSFWENSGTHQMGYWEEDE